MINSKVKDALRIHDKHKDKANFTCYISGTRTRIDRLYADSEFNWYIKEIKHIPFNKSDHKMIRLTCNISDKNGVVVYGKWIIVYLKMKTMPYYYQILSNNGK